MIPRRIYPLVTDALARQAAVALIGPRQVGKTTLALTIAEETSSLYLDLEAREDRSKLVEPALFLRDYEDRLVVLDEIHRVPELFKTLRGLIDAGRRHGRRTGRFLLLGSASMDLLRQSGESLAGRIAYVEMGPFDVLEIPAEGHDLTALWVRGGFPESYLARDDRQSLEWRKDFIRSYLERDIPLFGPRVPTETLERLWTMLAHGQGTLMNASRLAAALMISAHGDAVHRPSRGSPAGAAPAPISQQSRQALGQVAKAICAGLRHSACATGYWRSQCPRRPSCRRGELGRICYRKSFERRPRSHECQLLSHLRRCRNRPGSGISWRISVGGRGEARTGTEVGEGISFCP